MENIMKFIAGTFVVGIVVIIIILSGKENTVYVPNNDTQAEFKQGFMEGCMGEDASYGECSCMYDGMLAEYGFSKLIKVSAEYAETNELPEAVVDIALICTE